MYYNINKTEACQGLFTRGADSNFRWGGAGGGIFFFYQGQDGA